MKNTKEQDWKIPNRTGYSKFKKIMISKKHKTSKRAEWTTGGREGKEKAKTIGKQLENKQNQLNVLFLGIGWL